MATFGPKAINELPVFEALTGNEYVPLQLGKKTGTAQLVQVAGAIGDTAYVKKTALSDASGAAAVGLSGLGAGAIARDLLTRAREVVHVTDYADSPTTTHGDGVVDDYGMFSRALAANPGKCIYAPTPSVSYTNATGTLTLPANTTLIGAARKTTRIAHKFNGHMFEMGDGASVINLNVPNLLLPDNSAGYAGRCFNFSGTNGRQSVTGVKAQAWEDEVMYFAVAAGSQSVTFDCTLARRNAGTGTGRCAVVIDPTEQLGAVPRGFIRIETDGTCAFNFGGCNDTFLSSSFISDLVYTPSSRGVIVTACRIANQAALTLDGHNNVIDACDVAPQITIALNADNCHLGTNTYNNLPIIDNSGNPRNTMTHWVISYAPTLTSGGTAPAIGNGSILGYYSRAGSTITFSVEIAIGSTTSLGTGGLSVSLPQKRHSGGVFVGGTVLANRSGTLYAGVLQIAGAVTTASLLRDTTGAFTFNSPGTFAAGDTIRLSCTYTI